MGQSMKVNLTYSDKIRETHGLLRVVKPAPLVAQTALVPTVLPKFNLPVVQGLAPEFSLISLIDRYLFSLNGEEPQFNVKVRLGGPRSQGVFHPSEICKEDACHRAMAYELIFAPASKTIDARLRRIFDNGHFTHARIQHVVTEAVKTVGGLFKDEIRLPINPERVAGTTDGGMIVNQWPYLLEIKSMNKKNFVALGKAPWEEHYDQLNIYMRLSRVKAAIILIECKDNQDQREFFVRYDEKRWMRIENVTKTVLGYVMADQLPERISAENGCQGKDCKFYEICKGSQQNSWRPNFNLLEMTK